MINDLWLNTGSYPFIRLAPGPKVYLYSIDHNYMQAVSINFEESSDTKAQKAHGKHLGNGWSTLWLSNLLCNEMQARSIVWNILRLDVMETFSFDSLFQLLDAHTCSHPLSSWRGKGSTQTMVQTECVSTHRTHLVLLLFCQRGRYVYIHNWQDATWCQKSVTFSEGISGKW